MTLYAETSAVLRWLFAEEDGEALRAVLISARKVTSSFPDLRILSADERVSANAVQLGFGLAT